MEWGTDGPLAKHSGTKDAKCMKCIHLTRPLTTPEPAARRRVRHRRCLFWRRANRTPEIYMHISLSQKANGQCAHFLFCQRWNWSAGRLHHSFMGTPKKQQSWACHPGPEDHKPRVFSPPSSVRDSRSLISYLIWVRKLEFPAVSCPADERLTRLISE